MDDPLNSGRPGGTLPDAVMREVAQLLDALAADPGAEATIDLHGLPLSGADRAVLADRLGRGEVQAVLDVAGPTHIQETAFAGVWWIRHGDVGDPAAIEQLVVARIPALLPAHPDDIGDAARRLRGAVEVLATTEESVHE